MQMFDLYALLLILSGFLLVIVGSALPRQTLASRILNVLVGLAFLGYGCYLEFIFTGGTYRVFFYAFLVPILLVVRTFKARKEARLAREQAATAAPVAAGAAPQGAPMPQAVPMPQAQPDSASQ
jgi:hypothetical protein